MFGWLVSKHSGKLFGPSDFRHEENYVKMQLAAVASLTAASAKNQDAGATSTLNSEINDIVDIVQHAAPSLESTTDNSRNHVLWVDDNPDNNIHERRAFEAVGVKFTLALSTKEALKRLEQTKFAAIISDMGRKEGPREGYVLLDELRRRGDQTPFFIYASSNAPEHRAEAQAHGGQGSTNIAQVLFEMVMRSILSPAPS
jgi:CheY-like chemotaxis protein